MGNKPADPITIEEIQEAIDLIQKQNYKPIVGLDVGKDLFENLSELSWKKEELGNLWGIEIRLDETLRPNQYKIIKEK